MYSIQRAFTFSYVGIILTLNAEMNKAVTEKRALDMFEGSLIGNTGTRIVNDIEVNTNYSLVSAITMIAPSPDWFTGVHDYNLCNDSNGKWLEKRVKDLNLYDSGTDDAPRFVHTDTPSKPPVPIFLITNKHEGSLKSNKTIRRFGTFTFKKITKSPSSESPSNESPSIPTSPTSGVSSLGFSVKTFLVLLSVFISMK